MKGRVVIVDDEPQIRKGIIRMIEESPVPWEVAGEAADGEEALAVVAEVRPDLVITDIRMPVMDGLALCERLWQRGGPDVIVLTAYKDFEFAQKALRFGAVDFVLKPCSEEELNRSLEKAYGVFAAKQERIERERAERRALQEHNLRSRLLGLSLSAAAADDLHRELDGKEWAVCKVDTYLPAGRPYRREDAGLLQFALHNIMRELFDRHGLEGVIVAVKRDVFAVAAAPSPSFASFAAELRRTAAELLGLTTFVDLLGAVSLDAVSARAAAYIDHAHPDGLDGESLERSETIRAELLSFLRLGQIEALREYLDRFARRTAELDEREAKLEALGLVLALVEVGVKHFATRSSASGGENASGGAAAVGRLGEWVAALHPIRSPASVAEWLAEPIRNFNWELDSWLAAKNDGVLEKTLDYIERHYAGDCTIHDAARHVHLSVSYFSFQFKKETGETFTNFLTKFRMEKAQILLSNTKMKIADIAEAVGYADPNYFTTVFRHTCGCSPSEYRKQSAR